MTYRHYSKHPGRGGKDSIGVEEIREIGRGPKEKTNDSSLAAKNRKAFGGGRERQ